ncbi:replication protein A 32 kDa subunit-like [Brachionichthys hirsutus]|uniref:replication protein A 32 kDa subunit-like n=1 Tax=Brachionichthys hirsutus TaxID=412623 RepID=UPI0036049EA8
MSSRKAAAKRAALQILPVTVSQLLSASQVDNVTFAFCGWQLNQVSVVGVVRGFAPFVTNIQYSVDDMTGPPLNVKQWVDAEASSTNKLSSPGSYVKVIGSLRNFSGQRSLLAMNIRTILNLNEMTSHMLEVVQAHMEFFGKVFDVNMNTSVSSLSERPDSFQQTRLSTTQDQVLHVIKMFSVSDVGISFTDLKKQLDYLSIRDIRTSLVFLVNEGHVFPTIDEQHFKSPAN